MTREPRVPAGERPHRAGPDRWWSEAWHLDAACADGTGLTVRLECYPNQSAAWFWAYLVRPDLPGPVVVRDHGVPLPRQGLEIRSEGLWAELWCETPLEHWTYGLEAFAVRLDDPADALGGDEIGERLPIGLDLEWEVGGPRHDRRAGWPVAGYVQPGRVHGEVLLGRGRFEIDCFGERRHSWGVRDWFGHSGWTCGFRSGETVVHVAARDDSGVDGFVWRGGAEADPVRTARCETHRRADGLPVAARCVVDADREADVEVLGLAPVSIAGRAASERAMLARALCRITLDGTPGCGWATWLDPAVGRSPRED